MPAGPNGQKRPADTNACAVMVARIATGEIGDDCSVIAAKRGQRGGQVRAEKLGNERRVEIAKIAAAGRWR